MDSFAIISQSTLLPFKFVNNLQLYCFFKVLLVFSVVVIVDNLTFIINFNALEVRVNLVSFVYKSY